MQGKFGIVYFIHDAIGNEFVLNVLPNILKAEISDDIHILLVHNERKQFGNVYVTFKTEVKQLVLSTNNYPSLKIIHSPVDWEQGLGFAFAYLTAECQCTRLGLITLSHSAGFVINRNNEQLPILTKIKMLIARLRNRFSNSNLKPFGKKLGNGREYISTKTIVAKRKEEGGSLLPVSETVYTRKAEEASCRKYEGLFTFQLSNFLTENGIKLSFLISSNCNFQLYDNGFLFAPAARFIMGAQSYGDFEFWDFPVIVRTIRNNYSLEERPLCEKIFTECERVFFEQFDNVTLHYFLIETRQIAVLHLVFDEILAGIIERLGTNTSYRAMLQEWTQITEGTSDYWEVPFYDMMGFFVMADKRASNIFKHQVEKLQEIMTTEIVCKKHSMTNDHCGFSLYLPRNAAEFNQLRGGQCNYFNPDSINTFVKNSRYDEFLMSLYST